MSETVDRLLELALERGAIKYGDFTLTSGKKSSYYFDGRLLSLDPEGAHLIAQALIPLLQQAGAKAVGGTTLGYCSIGRTRMAITPTSVTMIASTVAKIGRLIKKLEKFIIARPLPLQQRVARRRLAALPQRLALLPGHLPASLLPLPQSRCR